MGSMRVTVPGAELAVTVAGDGPPLLWAHGLTSSMNHEDDADLFDWSGLAETSTVARYDARGHGTSAASRAAEDYRWDHLAGDYLAVADALGFDRLVAGGASMGAATVLHVAVLAPARVEAMVLAIPPTAWATRAAQAGLYRAGADLAEAEGTAALRAARASVPPPAIFADEPALTDFTPDVAEADLPTVLRGAAASDLPPLPSLAELTQRTLILAWDTDPGHPVAAAEALAAALPDARLQVATDIAAVRRWPAQVADFLTAVRGGGR